MTPVEVVASIRAEQAALEHVVSLVLEIHHRLATIAADDTPAEIDIRVGLVFDRWRQLDEFGVDLNLPDLKTLVAAHAANHPTSSGAVTAQTTPPAPTDEDVAATPLPAPLDPTAEELAGDES